MLPKKQQEMKKKKEKKGKKKRRKTQQKIQQRQTKIYCVSPLDVKLLPLFLSLFRGFVSSHFECKFVALSLSLFFSLPMLPSLPPSLPHPTSSVVDTV